MSATHHTSALEARDLGVRFGDATILHSITLALPRSRWTSIVGPNGAGKSTLLKALMGFVPAHSGKVRIEGLAIPLALRRQLVAYMPQTEQVDWQFPIRVADVVMMGRYGRMSLLRLAGGEDRRAVRQALERVDLWPLRGRQIGSLSGGERKRAFLARTLAQEADVLLLDEPFAGVDIRTERLIIEVLLERRAAGAAVLIATHGLEAIPGFCDQVVLINRTVVAYGETTEVFTQANLLRTFSTSPSSGA